MQIGCSKWFGNMANIGLCDRIFLFTLILEVQCCPFTLYLNTVLWFGSCGVRFVMHLVCFISSLWEVKKIGACYFAQRHILGRRTFLFPVVWFLLQEQLLTLQHQYETRSSFWFVFNLSRANPRQNRVSLKKSACVCKKDVRKSDSHLRVQMNATGNASSMWILSSPFVSLFSISVH